MLRFSLVLLFVSGVFAGSGYAQCVVYKHEDGRVLTTCDYYSESQTITARPSHTQRTYLGSPFLTYPVWQQGSMLLDRKGKSFDCELAYNLVTNEVLCRLPGDSAVRTITPEVFTINGVEFIRQQNKIAGIDYRLYATVLYDGPTKLLASFTNPPGDYVLSTSYRLDDTDQNNATIRNNRKADVKVSGAFNTQTNYYIRKGESKPELIRFTKNAVLAVLYEQSDKLAASVPQKNLSPDDVVNLLATYDSLMAADRENKLPLLTDPVFAQTLHDKIHYPNYAQSQGIYGRVYTGFEIDGQGQVKDVVTLSPTNAGFRFDLVVKNALEKLPAVDPSLRGKYALPVAFTFTNTNDNTGTHIPVNRLSDDRLEGRTVLNEYVVKAIVSKPPLSNKEVWGYFK